MLKFQQKFFRVYVQEFPFHHLSQTSEELRLQVFKPLQQQTLTSAQKELYWFRHLLSIPSLFMSSVAQLKMSLRWHSDANAARHFHTISGFTTLDGYRLNRPFLLCSQQLERVSQLTRSCIRLTDEMTQSCRLFELNPLPVPCSIFELSQ